MIFNTLQWTTGLAWQAIAEKMKCITQGGTAENHERPISFGLKIACRKMVAKQAGPSQDNNS